MSTQEEKQDTKDDFQKKIKAGAESAASQQTPEEKQPTQDADEVKGVAKEETSQQNQTPRKPKRAICGRCDRPERACICASLPTSPICLQNTHCLVLQHPYELKRKNRSVPLVQLCLSNDSLSVEVARRMHTKISDNFRTKMYESKSPMWVIFPCEEAISLQDALAKKAKDEANTGETQKIRLLFLDATWQFAKEMDSALRQRNMGYPPNILRVQLDDQDVQLLKKAKRFSIRTPPSERHLSTAEAMAFVLSKVERDDSIYETIMKPLDDMVEKWESFAQQAKKRRKEESERGKHEASVQKNQDQLTTMLSEPN